MFTEEEKKYYQSKQPKYPPAEKISSILENNSPIRSKPNGQYNIITGSFIMYNYSNHFNSELY